MKKNLIKSKTFSLGNSLMGVFCYTIASSALAVVPFPVSEALYEAGARTVVGFTGMPSHIDQEATLRAAQVYASQEEAKAQKAGIPFNRDDVIAAFTRNTPVRTKILQADQLPLPVMHLMTGGGDDNTFGTDPVRNLGTNAKNLLPLHPLREASYDFEGVDWDAPLGDTVPQPIADLMSNHPAIYTTYVLPRFGMRPISYGPDASKWKAELDIFIGQVGEKASSYFTGQGIQPYHPGAEAWGYHPFATAEDPSGCKGAASYLKEHGLTFRHLLTTNPFTDAPVTTGIDHIVNIPFTSNPWAPHLIVRGNSFYFRPGKNAAIDIQLEVEDETGVLWDSFMERKSNEKGADGSPKRYDPLSDGSPFELAFVGGMVRKFEIAPTTVLQEMLEEGGILLDLSKILREKFPGAPVLPAYGKGVVAKEGRQSSTSETESLYYKIKFNGWEDLAASTVLGEIIDVDEASRFMFVRRDLTLARVAAALGKSKPVLPSGELMPVSRFFASHGEMEAAILAAEGVDLTTIKTAPIWEEAHLTPLQIKEMLQK
jgi:hypothetical protein